MDKSKFKNIRIEYRCDTTINTGDFQNIKPGFTLSADVEDGASPTEAKNFLVSVVDAWIEEEVAKVAEGRK